MTPYVIDSCSLLNLVTGWQHLTEFNALKWSMHICDAVLNETEYTREFDASGKPFRVPLDIRKICAEAAFVTVKPDPAEYADYIDFASEIDDGEAQALAIAKHRGFILLTDDNKATNLARQPEIAVSTISTAFVLQKWATLKPQNEQRLGEIIRRITVLARFKPRVHSDDYGWWCRYL